MYNTIHDLVTRFFGHLVWHNSECADYLPGLRNLCHNDLMSQLDFAIDVVTLLACIAIVAVVLGVIAPLVQVTIVTINK